MSCRDLHVSCRTETSASTSPPGVVGRVGRVHPSRVLWDVSDASIPPGCNGPFLPRRCQHGPHKITRTIHIVPGEELPFL